MDLDFIVHIIVYLAVMAVGDMEVMVMVAGR